MRANFKACSDQPPDEEHDKPTASSNVTSDLFSLSSAAGSDHDSSSDASDLFSLGTEMEQTSHDSSSDASDLFSLGAS